MAGAQGFFTSGYLLEDRERAPVNMLEVLHPIFTPGAFKHNKGSDCFTQYDVCSASL